MSSKDLIAELKKLFEGKNQEEVEKAVKKVLEESYPEIITDPLFNLFDKQIEELKKIGSSKEVIISLETQRNVVVGHAVKMKISKNNIPFLPVIPQKASLGISYLMKMIENTNHKGRSDLKNISQLTNTMGGIPKEPYFIFNVSGGQDILGKSPHLSESVIKEQKGYCLTVEESIALCIHSDVLTKHNLDCSGSRIGKQVPSISIQNGRAVLYSSNPGASNEKWATPSCKERIKF